VREFAVDCIVDYVIDFVFNTICIWHAISNVSTICLFCSLFITTLLLLLSLPLLSSSFASICCQILLPLNVVLCCCFVCLWVKPRSLHSPCSDVGVPHHVLPPPRSLGGSSAHSRDNGLRRLPWRGGQGREGRRVCESLQTRQRKRGSELILM
jgi:hypothetical protein